MRYSSALVRILVVLLPYLFAPPSGAEVNPINGAFYYVLPITADSSASLPAILLSYEHQNQTRGFFGQGWCSELDARLKLESGTRAGFQSCRGGPDLHFEKSNDQFMTLGRSNPSAYPRIHLTEGNFVVERSPIERFTFDKNGQLVAVEKMNKVLTIQHSNDVWLGIDGQKKTVLKLQFNTASRITSVTYKGRQIQFSYENDLLGSVVDRRLGKTWNFKYDPEGRITSVTEPSRKTVSVKYSKKLNLVEQIADNTCATALNYSFLSASEFGLDTIAKCGAKTQRRKYKFKVSDQSIATEVKNDKGEVLATQLEDKITGKPSSKIKADGTTYVFNDDHLLEQKLSKSKKVRYTYGRDGALSEIEIADSTGYRQAQLRYDKQSRLRAVDLGEREIQVSNGSDGMELKFSSAKFKLQNGQPATFLNDKPIKGMRDKLSFSQTREILSLGYALDVLKERENAYIF